MKKQMINVAYKFLLYMYKMYFDQLHNLIRNIEKELNEGDLESVKKDLYEVDLSLGRTRIMFDKTFKNKP